MSQKIVQKPLRIGIIGAGGIVKQRHLPALLKMQDEVRIVAVANQTTGSAQRFVQQHVPGARALDKWEQVASDDEVDAVWVGATPWLHKDATIMALNHGKHVFCQARMARDLSEAGQMWEASLRYPELVTALCPAPHGMTGGEYVKQLLADKAIGDPIHCVLNSFNDAWLDPNKPPHWRQRVDVSGLQVLTLGIYVEVLHRWLGDIVQVQADGGVAIPDRGGYEVEVPDYLNVLCQFRSGVRGALMFSGVASHGRSDELSIFGTEGTLVYDFANERVLLGKPGKPLEELPIPSEHRREWTVEKDFVNAVLDPEAPRPKPDFVEGMRYMRVVQSVALAQDSGEAQRVC
ncbi:MAG: Gfo/Idh/MocA family oxidoreductase [Verrucomicrobiaceae bacterium]|nr:Gfo/Idh/MocA family oxidoreductase [Verrucomicrobiaceae bacterium]